MTLPSSRIADVTINFIGAGAQRRNFGVLLLVSDNTTIDQVERLRLYNSLTEVSNDLGSADPATLAATVYYSQSPQPDDLYVGRWVQADSAGQLKCGALTDAEQVITLWQAITDGEFEVEVDAVSQDVTALDFSGDANLDAVATTITTGLTGATCAWRANENRFVITSSTTGASSSISALDTVAVPAGTDISATLKGTTGTLLRLVPGVVAETYAEAVTALEAASIAWYNMHEAATASVGDSDVIAAAAIIEASAPARFMYATDQNTNALDPAFATDLGSELKDDNLDRSSVQYSSSSKYAAVSIAGRTNTIDFAAADSALTIKFKQEPGITAENLTSAQANALQGKNVNVFASYENGTAIVQEGTVASGKFIDEILNMDWLANAIETDVYNLLYGARKIPQTDDGQSQIVARIEAVAREAVNNGIIGENLIWRGPDIGQIVTSQVLPSGFYTYAQPFNTQNATDRAARIAPPITLAVNLAGAIHFQSITVEVNR